MQIKTYFRISVLLCLALSACTAALEPLDPTRVVEPTEPPQAAASQATPTGAAPAEGEEAGESETPAPQAESPNLDAVALAAAAEAARRLDVPLEQVKVLGVEAVEWPTPALGCPLPGAMYAQVITPGYRVEIDVNGTPYEIHTDLGQTLTVCTPEGEPVLPSFPVTPGDIDDGKPWMPVD